VPQPHLAQAIDALGSVSYAGEAYRHVAPGRSPLSGAGARFQGGRWNPPQSFATLYFGLERETVIAEFERLAARSGLAPGDFLPRRFYRYAVRLERLVDLRDPAARAALAITGTDLASKDLSTCQAIGEAGHRLGYEGILAPSAAGHGTVLAIFSDRLRSDSHVTDLDYVTWEAPPR